MQGWLALICTLAAAMVGCFDPPIAACPFLCGPNASCPEGYVCVADDNKCHHRLAGGAPAACDDPDAAPDASMIDGAVDSSVVDGSAIDASSPDSRVDAVIDAPFGMDAPPPPIDSPIMLGDGSIALGG